MTGDNNNCNISDSNYHCPSQTIVACNLSSQSAYFISQIDGLALTFTSLNWDRWDTIISYANQNTDQSRR